MQVRSRVKLSMKRDRDDDTNSHSNTLQNLLEAYLPQTLGVGAAEQVVLALQNLMAMDSVRHVDHIAALTSLLIEHLAPMDGLRCACQKSPAREPCDTRQRHANRCIRQG